MSMVVQKTPQIMVLLAAHNGTRWIAAQIDSILAQQAVAVQVVLSIDRSTDGTEAWAAQLAQQDARVTVLPGGQVFGGAAPNFFRLLRDVDMAGCDYVALADQDDLWHPDKLARACQQPGFVVVLDQLPVTAKFDKTVREQLLDCFQDAADFWAEQGVAFRCFYSYL